MKPPKSAMGTVAVVASRLRRREGRAMRPAQIVAASQVIAANGTPRNQPAVPRSCNPAKIHRVSGPGSGASFCLGYAVIAKPSTPVPSTP